MSAGTARYQLYSSRSIHSRFIVDMSSGRSEYSMRFGGSDGFAHALASGRERAIGWFHPSALRRSGTTCRSPQVR